MSTSSRRSSCQRASDATDGTQRWRYRTRSGRANSACNVRGRPHKAARANARDFRPLEPKPRHQSLLAERKGVDVLGERGARHARGSTLVHDNHAWARPDGPPVALLEVVEGGVRHEEQRVAEPLPTRLQSERGRRDVVVGDRFSALSERTVTGLTAKNKAALVDLREDEDCFGALAKPSAHLTAHLTARPIGSAAQRQKSRVALFDPAALRRLSHTTPSTPGIDGTSKASEDGSGAETGANCVKPACV